MLQIITLIILINGVRSANYNRHDYTTPGYKEYSTINNLFNQIPYKTGYTDTPYSNQNSRYPNYNPTGYSSNNYNNMYDNTNQLYSENGYNSDVYSGYSTSRYANEYSSYEYPFMKSCVNRSPQNGIYVDKLMGMWYGVEYIQHLTGDSRVDYTDSCIVIHLSEPAEEPSTEAQLYHVQHINAKFRQEYRHLRLLWDEAGRTSEYALFFRNETAGYWQVVDGQNGTLTQVPGFRHFSGTVQVLKAVNDHLLLSFCQEPVGGRSPQLYSVLFSRDPGVMPRWEINSVHTLLQNKKLSVASRRLVCGNGAVKVVYSMIFSILSCAFAYLVSADV